MSAVLCNEIRTALGAFMYFILSLLEARIQNYLLSSKTFEISFEIFKDIHKGLPKALKALMKILRRS